MLAIRANLAVFGLVAGFVIYGPLVELQAMRRFDVVQDVGVYEEDTPSDRPAPAPRESEPCGVQLEVPGYFSYIQDGTAILTPDEPYIQDGTAILTVGRLSAKDKVTKTQ